MEIGHIILIANPIGMFVIEIRGSPFDFDVFDKLDYTRNKIEVKHT